MNKLGCLGYIFIYMITDSVSVLFFINIYISSRIIIVKVCDNEDFG